MHPLEPLVRDFSPLEVKVEGTRSSLMLGANPLGDDGAAALARGFEGGALRELWLDGCRIGDRGALALAAAPWLPALERLELTWNPLTPRGVAALRAAPFAPGALVLDR